MFFGGFKRRMGDESIWTLLFKRFDALSYGWRAPKRGFRCLGLTADFGQFQQLGNHDVPGANGHDDH